MSGCATYSGCGGKLSIDYAESSEGGEWNWDLPRDDAWYKPPEHI